MAVYSLRFILDPQRMAALTLPVNLRWRQTSFRRESVGDIAEAPGVYAFALRHGQPGLPPHGYVLYIGQVGGRIGPARTLRARFREYLGEKSGRKRERVAYFLNNWETCLCFTLPQWIRKRWTFWMSRNG